MKKWMVLAVALLAGCTTQPAEQRGVSSSSSSASSGYSGSSNTDSRQRARTQTDLAAAYYVRGQYKIALDELRKAIVADSGYGPAYDIYGRIYMELAEYSLAEENFRRAIDLDGNDSVARNDYGWFLCTRGRYDEGLSQFSAALQNPLYTRPEEAMANAGLCAAKKGDFALAETNLTKSLKLQPDNPNTVLKLAELYLRQGRLMDAQRQLSRHAELSQPTAESLWLAVRLERKQGDRSQEAMFGSQLRKRFPDSNEAQLLRSGQYE